MENSPEKAVLVTAVASRIHQNLTERRREPAAPQVVEVAHQESTTDVIMDVGNGAHDAVFTDYSYDSHASEEPDSVEIDSPDDEIHICDRPIANGVDLGQAIWFAFDDDMSYDVNDERNMFDEDLSDDESSDSSLSSNYEELMDVSSATRVVFIKNDEGDDDESNSDDSMDGDEEYDTEQAWEDDRMPSADHESTAGNNTPPTEEISGKAQIPVPATLEDICKADLQMKKEEEARDRFQWRVKELQEMLRELERQIPEAESQLENADRKIKSKKEENKTALEASGLSTEIVEAYNEFCESLHPEFGLRDGFSITCNSDHGGSYVKYDPEFGIFKECVEIDYKMCNFRSEASCGKVVEFWPIRCPEPLTGVETTWGEQYPELYRPVFQAAKQGSEPAMEMLVRLPGENASLGGWLFEYKLEDLLKDEPIVSRRWSFCSAHEIDRPLSVEEKRYRLSLQIQSTR